MTDKIKVGLINIMPNVSQYEKLIHRTLLPLKEKIEIHPIKLSTHEYRSSASQVESYSTFSQLVKRENLDFLVITGAPVENLHFDDIAYWKELTEILAYADIHIKSVLGICFGGLCLAKYLGVEKFVLNEKLYGIYTSLLTNRFSNYFPKDQKEFLMPMSTWAILDENSLANQKGRGISGIAHHPEIGHTLLESNDRKFFMILGHPEYSVDTLFDEWLRDKEKKLSYTDKFNDQSFVHMRHHLEFEKTNVIENWIASHTC